LTTLVIGVRLYRSWPKTRPFSLEIG